MIFSRSVATGRTSSVSVASIPVSTSTVGHDPVSEPTQRTVAPLPEATGPRTRLAVRTEPRQRQRRRQRQQGWRSWSRRPVGPARAALLPVAREESAMSVRSIVWHDEVEIGWLVAHVREHVVRMLMRFSCPRTTATAGPVTIPPLERQTLLGFIIADLSVFELPLLC